MLDEMMSQGIEDRYRRLGARRQEIAAYPSQPLSSTVGLGGLAALPPIGLEYDYLTSADVLLYNL